MSQGIPPSLEYLGYARYASCSSAVTPATSTPTGGVKLPATCNYATMTVLTQDIVMTNDGTTTPTATVGVRYPKGTMYFFDNARTMLASLSFIQQTASAEVVFGWYRG